MAGKKYPREALLWSRRFAKYQQDFLGAVLHKPEYTLREAVKAVEAFFERSEG